MRAKKYLGQNFLKSGPALKKIVEAGEIKPGDVVLEIGPGKGVLTEKILETGVKVIAVEKDPELLEILQEKFTAQINSGLLTLVNEDILDFEIKKFKVKSYKVIANIPYNITGTILRKFLTAEHQPERMVLMIQKEVAQRILARDGKESILSISVKAYGEPKMVMKVEARYFSPAPKVDSAVIAIKNISREFFKKNGVNEKKFWEIAKAGFAHKRKLVLNNLKNAVSEEKSAFLLKNARAEDLKLEDWLKLSIN